MKTYTAYITLSYDGEDPQKRTCLVSVDVTADLLAFVSRLTDAILGDSVWEIDEVLITPPGELSRKVPEEHFNSIDEFITRFRGVRFKAKS